MRDINGGTITGYSRIWCFIRGDSRGRWQKCKHDTGINIIAHLYKNIKYERVNWGFSGESIIVLSLR